MIEKIGLYGCRQTFLEEVMIYDMDLPPDDRPKHQPTFLSSKKTELKL
jgi:hypothetical protein